MPIPSRASAWVLASSLLFFCPAAPAQLGDRAGGAAAPGATPGLPARNTGTGRDQFIAPVMGIQIEGEGLNLPPEATEEQPAKPAAKPPAEAKPVETKEPEPRSTEK